MTTMISIVQAHLEQKFDLERDRTAVEPSAFGRLWGWTKRVVGLGGTASTGVGDGPAIDEGAGAQTLTRGSFPTTPKKRHRIEGSREAGRARRSVCRGTQRLEKLRRARNPPWDQSDGQGGRSYNHHGSKWIREKYATPVDQSSGACRSRRDPGRRATCRVRPHWRRVRPHRNVAKCARGSSYRHGSRASICSST